MHTENAGETTDAAVDEVDVEDVDPEDESEELEFVYDITAYGVDYTTDALAKRMAADDIVVPDFQRRFVWPKPKCDRFVESLLLGLPVPGIFLAKQDSGKHLVIDGQQRLCTISAYFEGVLRGKEFELGAGVQRRFRGKTYKSLDEDDRRRLDDAVVHATVIRQVAPSEDQSSIYFVFERLNTGGMLLQPQEIRSAIFQGALNDLLADLNDLESWRSIFGPESKRFKDRELVLRYFAFLYATDGYRPPMKEFLNEFMGSNRDLSKLDGREMSARFEAAIDVLLRAVDSRDLFRIGKTVNAAVFDSVMIGVSRALETWKEPPAAASIEAAYRELLENEDYQQSVSRTTANPDRVAARMELATDAFAQAE